MFYGTISKTVPLRQTEPDGNPTAAVGMFLMDRLFTKVVQVLSAQILFPTIILLLNPQVSFNAPPNIAEKDAPAGIVLLLPPPITERSAAIILKQPPPITATADVIMFK